MSLVKVSGNASGTGTLTIAAPNTNTDYTLTLPQATTTLVGTDATQTLTNKTIQGGAITSGTAVASTSGTSIDFTSIPSWVKRITLMFNGVSNVGADSLIVYRLGTASGIETTGYNAGVGAVTTTNNTTRGAANTTGFPTVHGGNGNDTWYGSIVFSNMGSNTWAGFGTNFTSLGTTTFTAGTKTLGGTLTQVRVTSANGTDTFDAGSINILYEG